MIGRRGAHNRLTAVNPPSLPVGLQPRLPAGCVLDIEMTERSRNQIDRSGYHNDGASAGATLKVQDGVIGAVRSFDGVDDTINLGATPSCALSTFALEFWISPSTLSGVNAVCGRYIGASNGWYIYLGSTGALSLVYYYPAGASFGTAAGVISTGVWQHVVINFATGSNTSFQVYVNGVLKYSNTSTAVITVSTSRNFYIASLEGSGDFYAGLMGLFRMYNQILTAEDILSLYRASAGRYGVKG
jgi:hypothetical protein